MALTGESLVHDMVVTFDIDLAVDTDGLEEGIVVKLGASGNTSNDVTRCGADEQGIGVTVGSCFPAVNGDTSGLRRINVQLFGAVVKAKSTADISRGAVVGFGASGVIVSKTIDTSAPATTIRGLGIALDASTAGTDTNTQYPRIMMNLPFIPV